MSGRLALGWLLVLLAGGLHGAPLQRWLYCPVNLQVDRNIDGLEVLWRRAAKAGYTHVLLADSKFAKLGDVPGRYFTNAARVKALAAELRLEVVPAVFPVGYSNDILWHDPNLAEAMPVRDVPLVVSNGVARLMPDPALTLPGGDCTDLKQWSWKDDVVVAEAGAAKVKDPRGQNARLAQRVAVQPFRQYHLSVRVRTEAFEGTPEIKVLAGDRGLAYNHLGVKPTQDWQVHHQVFNSLEHREVSVYFGCWDGRGGSLWWDDARIEEVAFVNLVRRPGAPLTVRHEDGTTLAEGRDFEALQDPRMGVRLWPGTYDVFHEPPLLQAATPDGTRLRASYYHAVTVHEDQAMICPSELRTLELLRDQAQRMSAVWGAGGYMMSHDEIRVLNWCKACEDRRLSAGAILADNVRSCVKILRGVNPGGRIYVWSDMFDPNHNAHADYYLVRGDLAGSWEGLDPEVIVVPWYFEKRRESLQFFADRGHRQVIAGYYDDDPANVRRWLEAAMEVKGVEGVMYTTWQNRYDDLERFAELMGGR